MKGALAKLRGVFSTCGENRNNYSATKASWDNAFNDPILQEKFANGGMIGRLDHTHSQDESEEELREACVLIKDIPQVDEKGNLVGECYILDNNDGRTLYSLCQLGMTPGISFNGDINGDLMASGDEEGAWKDFLCKGFDIVYVPAYKEARLTMVEDYGNPKDVKMEAARRTASRVAASLNENTRKRVFANDLVDKDIVKDIVALNKEMEKALKEVGQGGDIKEKAKIFEVEKENPEHVYPKQEGNTIAADCVVDAKTDDKMVDEEGTKYTVETIDKGNGEPLVGGIELSKEQENERTEIKEVANMKVKADEDTSYEGDDELPQPAVETTPNLETIAEGVASGDGEKVSGEVAILVQDIAELRGQIETLTAEKEACMKRAEMFENRCKQHKKTIAANVDFKRGVEAQKAELEKREKEQAAKIKELSSKVAALEADNRREQARANMSVHKAQMVEKPAYKAMAALIADEYAIDGLRLYSKLDLVKNRSNLETVIAELQRTTRQVRQGGMAYNKAPEKVANELLDELGLTETYDYLYNIE